MYVYNIQICKILQNTDFMYFQESFHQERSLNTVPIVHWLPNNRNFKLFLTNTNVTSRSLNYAYTIRVWMTMFCFLWTVPSNLFMFDVVCHLLNFPQNLLSLLTKHSFWGYIRCWNCKIFLAKMLNLG
jgi:hypothetical protein